MNRIERVCCWTVVLWLALAVIVSYAAGQATVIPGQSIQAAINANPTGTVDVAPGIYYENLVITTPVQLVSTGGPSVTTIQGDDVSPPNLRNSTVTYEDADGGFLLEGFTIRGGWAHNSQLYGGGVYVHATVGGTIRGCVITDNLALAGCGIGLGSSSVLIEHNTIVGNLGSTVAAIRLSTSSGGSVIRDNIVWGNVAPIALSIANTGTLIENNCLEGPAPGYTPATLAASGTVLADPLLDATYHLLPGSPCIGTGTGGSDMGAYVVPPLAPPNKIAVATGLSSPVFATHRPGEPGVIYILEREGRIIRVSGGIQTVWRDYTTLVSSGGERGLLGLAFTSDGHHIVNYTDLAGDTQISLYSDAEDIPPASLLSIPQPYQNHNGGWIGIGPDGLLYVATGDGGGVFNPSGSAQDPANLLGKILRMKAVPGAVPEIWLMGLRNPWGCSWDGTDLWIADTGQYQREEVDRVPVATPVGTNLGWACYEGTLPTGLCFVGSWQPEFEYDHQATTWTSTVGGQVYRGSAISQMVGQYICADYGSSAILAWDGTALTRITSLDGGINHPAGIGVDSDGELLIVSIGTGTNGTVYRITP